MDLLRPTPPSCVYGISLNTTKNFFQQPTRGERLSSRKNKINRLKKLSSLSLSPSPHLGKLRQHWNKNSCVEETTENFLTWERLTSALLSKHFIHQSFSMCARRRVLDTCPGNKINTTCAIEQPPRTRKQGDTEVFLSHHKVHTPLCSKRRAGRGWISPAKGPDAATMCLRLQTPQVFSTCGAANYHESISEKTFLLHVPDSLPYGVCRLAHTRLLHLTQLNVSHPACAVCRLLGDPVHSIHKSPLASVQAFPALPFPTLHLLVPLRVAVVA